MKALGILAYGSVIDNPGKEIEAATENKLELKETPFPVEYAYASERRNGAPTLVPVESGGAKVACVVFVLKDGISEQQASNILYRREIHQSGSKKEYSFPEEGKENTIYIEKISNFNSVQTILYTKILPNITPLTAEELAKRAIESALSKAGDAGLDGVSYLKKTKSSGIKTILSAEYEKAILKSVQADNLDQALSRLSIERLKKKGKAPEDTQVIFKMPTVEDVEKLDGKMVAFRAVIGQTYVKLAPPINIVSHGKNEELKLNIEYKHDYAANFLGLDATISKSYIYVGFPQGSNQQDVLDYFNNIMAIWNLLDFHLDFVTRSDVLVRAKGLGGYIELISSAKAHYRGYGLTPIELSYDEFLEIETLTTHLWKKISTSPYFKDDNFFQLLGYAKYYNYHGMHLLAFTHAWMFIESCVNLLWADLVEENFHKVGIKETSPASSERNWTSQIKIDELFLKGKIDLKLRGDIHDLRSKRNHVFHQDKKIEKRRVDEHYSNKAVETALVLFYKMIEISSTDKMTVSQKIKQRLWEIINRETIPH